MPRKVPFSVKQKKKQLQERRLRKQGRQRDSDSDDADDSAPGTTVESESVSINKINQQPQSLPDRRLDPNRFKLHFFKEKESELEKRRAKSREYLTMLPEKCLETDIEDIYKPGTVLDIPKRPEWRRDMSKESLEQREDKYFQSYLDDIFSVYGPRELSYFEMNLETWRQLWRVCEMSDILLLVTDIRHPALHFSPALYNYVTRDLGKPMILVLNKIDLAPLGLVVAWKDYFLRQFPKLHILYFTSYAEATKIRDSGLNLKKGHKAGRRIQSVGSRDLLNACEKIVDNKADLGSWRSKVERQHSDVDEDDDDVADGASSSPAVFIDTSKPDPSQGHVGYRDGILTIGCVGYPNVGKSSMINGLVGRKVVSVSKSPGHTKHFQTIFLTPTVKLCDCPGLVFPSLIEKPLQTLSGIYPVAQVSEPYSCIAYLASRVDIVTILKIVYPKDGSTKRDEGRWTAYDICTAWALKCGYNTARGARPDTYRAANHILRLTVEGRLRLNFTPPDYTENKDNWRQHPEVKKLVKQGQAVVYGVQGCIQPSSDSDQEEVTSSHRSANQKADSGQCVAVENPFTLLTDN